MKLKIKKLRFLTGRPVCMIHEKTAKFISLHVGNRVEIKNHKGIRKLTPKECFMIQGFPEDFKLPHNLSGANLYHQAGNSVTVSVVERIAEEMKRVLFS